MNSLRSRIDATLGAAALAALLVLAGCSGKAQDPQTQAAQAKPHNVTLTQEQQASIHTITISPSQYRTTIHTTGVVDFDHDRATQVVAPFSGAVTQVTATLGQYVVKGQPLAEVASPDFTAAAGTYRKAVLTATTADAVAVNDRALYARRAISQRENAQAQADAASADADRNAARETLVALRVPPAIIADIRAGRLLAYGQAVIRAPITGTVVEKSIAQGQTLAAGASPCFTIANTSRMWVMAKLFGNDIARVRVGDPATVLVGSGIQPIAGRVTNIAAVVNPDTRSVNARITVANPGDALKQQMYVNVEIQSRSVLQGLLLPVSAVLRNGQDLPFVYVVEPDGSYARRPISLGARVGNSFVIPNGLHPGDKVVVDGSIFLNFIQSQ